MSSLKRFCYVTLLDLCREGLYQTKRLLSWVPDHNITLNKSWLHQLWSWAQPIRIVRFYSTISYERTSSLTGFHHRTQFVHVLLFWSAGFTLVSGSTYDTFSSRDHFIKINVIIKINASVDVHSWFPGECPCPVTLTHRFQYCKIDGIMMKCTLVGLTENNDPIFLDSQTWTYCFHPV